MVKSQKIYIPLLDEGIEAWRPVNAEIITAETYRILDAIPEGEVWEFQPGDIVACRPHTFSDGTNLVAYKKV